jgi:hypothetical protein
MRHPALPEFDEIFPELRPKSALTTELPRAHWHGFGERPPLDPEMRFAIWNANSKNVLDHRWKYHTPPYGETTKENKEARERGEEPGNAEGIHVNPSPGKYHFPPNGKKDKEYWHDHDDQYTEKPRKNGKKRIRRDYLWTLEEQRQIHIEREHDGEDVEDYHWHPKRVKDYEDNLAARIDVHKWAQKRFDDADHVFFCIEGCIKADAILTAIRKERRKASVFSVPSVTLWGDPDLKEFAERRLLGKRVVIVPDADWVDNDRVIEQARLCQTYLRRLGVPDTYVAAPPHHYKKPDGEVKYKGVDDWLGAGGKLDKMLVIRRVVDDGKQRSWFRENAPHKNKLGFLRDTEMVHALAEHAGSGGQFHSTLARLARVTGLPVRRSARAVESLIEKGAVTVDGSLEIRQLYFMRGYGWAGDNPVITLHEELRGEDLPEGTLGEVLNA